LTRSPGVELLARGRDRTGRDPDLADNVAKLDDDGVDLLAKSTEFVGPVNLGLLVEMAGLERSRDVHDVFDRSHKRLAEPVAREDRRNGE
jgi:hypothetical protein